ncbi:AsmA-like C-terminal region-containing protein [Robiginitalea aurantiaca]|uniref:AsmA-like C-terminal region-containing protein n=1 Tax=Robiginitalea aurantiaca TaxID=3056915 RepID=A0ABT7WC26_9FLAO|nr:AsmA-like C-terminal region-containing protein [Robiginitalea aurantiaca]MDM9630466.1 AsmA-like C-terminal region-containing protein [Robiginitalea aurantiaca]
MTEHSSKKRWVLSGKIAGGIFVFWLLAMVLFPVLFHNWISQKVTDLTSDYLSSELRFKDTRATFFHHFPFLTLSMDEVELRGSGPFAEQPFIKAETLVFTIGIWRLLFTDQVDIKEIELNNGNVFFKTDRFGRQNYSVFTSPESKDQDSLSESGTEVYLDRIRINNTAIAYTDALRKLDIRTHALDYDGAGSFIEGKLQLGSHLDIDSVDVTFEDVKYLKGKPLKANLTTVYNDNDVSLLFEKNDLVINELALNYSGNLDFDPDGYSYKVDLSTEGSHLKEIISLLPARYVSWRDKADIDGLLDAKIHLSGLNNVVRDTAEASRMAVEINFRDGKLKYRDAPVPVEQIFLDFNGSLDNGVFEIEADTLSFILAEDFSRGNFYAKGHKDSLDLKTRLHAQLNLHLLQETLQLPGINFGGHLNADITAEGVYDKVNTHFPITDAEFIVKDGYLQTTFPDPIEDISIDFVLENTDGALDGTSVMLKNLSFNFEDNPFELKAELKNFEMLDYDIQARGSLDLNSFSQVAPLPYISRANGFVRLDARFKGHMVPGPEPGSSDLKVASNSGKLFLENVALNVQELPNPLEIVSGDFTFQLDKLEFSEFQIKYAGNSSLLNGYFTNYLSYLLVPDGILLGDFDFKSEFVDLDALIPKKEVPPETLAQTQTDSLGTRDDISGVLQVPANINFKLNADIDTLRHFKLDITELRGQISVTEGGFVFNDTRMNMVGGTATMKGFYKPEGNDRALFNYNLQGQNLDVHRAYDEIELFTDLVPAAQNASGIISLDYEIRGSMDQRMNPILPSLEGGGTLTVHDVQFKNYKFFGTVSRETRLGALKDPKMKEITVHSNIDDNLLELKRFKFKVKPFRLRLEGQTTLDGDMDLQMRLGLPPFGLIGIPIKITGTSDSLKIKMGRREKDLEALDYDDDEFTEEERRRFRMLRDSITENMDIEDIYSFEKRLDTLYFQKEPKVQDSLVAPRDTVTAPAEAKRPIPDVP